MQGLAPHTSEIFDQIAKLECIRPYVLVGGTALSLQIESRQSEDLDFMKWRTSKEEKMEVDWYHIEQELTTIAPIDSKNLMDFDHVEFVVAGVKVSFYASPKHSPVSAPVLIKDNIFAADLLSIGAMKMEVLLRRSNFRDYYDIYSLLQHGIDIQAMINLALRYSEHRLKTKNLLAMLTNGEHYTYDTNFEQLSPIYSVSTKEIEEYIKSKLVESSKR